MIHGVVYQKVERREPHGCPLLSAVSGALTSQPRAQTTRDQRAASSFADLCIVRETDGIVENNSIFPVFTTLLVERFHWSTHTAVESRRVKTRKPHYFPMLTSKTKLQSFVRRRKFSEIYAFKLMGQCCVIALFIFLFEAFFTQHCPQHEFQWLVFARFLRCSARNNRTEISPYCSIQEISRPDSHHSLCRRPWKKSLSVTRRRYATFAMRCRAGE